MKKTFVVKTTCLTDYDNLIEIDEEELEKYRQEFPELTDDDIVSMAFTDGNVIMLDCCPTDYRDEMIYAVIEIEKGE